MFLFESSLKYYNVNVTVVTAQSKALLCGRSLPGIVGSNPAGGMDFCLL
jgi:hypothetical protein